MRPIVVGLMSVIVASPAPAHAWGFDVHRFIMSRALDILPPAIRPFFDANRAFVVERAVDPDLWRTAGFTQESPNHFLDLDFYGAYPFTSLPRDYDEALKKYGRATLSRNGLLPWRTHEMAGRLIRGFRAVGKNAQYARSDVMYFSAIVGHYVADAHVPLHAVLNYNGQLTAQTGVHDRWETDLFVRFQKQLAINPPPIETIGSERDFVFATLLESAQLAAGVLSADKAAAGGRDVYDDEYFATFFAAARPTLERRLNESIAAVASMIASAWEKAGKPALPVNAPRRPPERRQVGRSAPANP